ncbi:MAG TPA: YfhO family protein [Bacteroidales bacterium]|nr:YfhO family protein [Bacteroidales bacterium]
MDRISFVDNADEEIAALTNIDLNSEAVVHKEFESVLEGFDLGVIDQPASVQPHSDQSSANQSIQNQPTLDQPTLLHSEIGQPSLNQPARQSTIKLVDYDSDYLIYEVDAIKDELAIFSDVYYPKGWQVSIDGEPAVMIRANYILRALAIPTGTHNVEFRFEPQSIKTTDGIAYAALLIMLLTSVYLIYRRIRTEKLEK